MAALAAQATRGGTPGWAARAGAAVVSLATAFVILGLTMIPFFTPAWIHFEQDRAGSAGLTGYASADVYRVTDSIVHDLILGGEFDVNRPSCPPLSSCPMPTVLDQAEISHMRDVRGVFGGFALVVVVSLAGLLIAGWRLRRAAASARATTWAAVRRGAAWLAILLVVLGVVALTAFDTAFTLFHEVFFPGGNWSFDPRTEKLVQLFPDQFWSDTTMAWGAVAIAVSILVAWFAGRRRAAVGGEPTVRGVS